jgi:hypothetical protein
MNAQRRSTLPALSALCTLMLSLPAIAQAPSDLQRCRALKDNAARLACYDAIPVSATAPAASAAAPAAGSTAAAAPVGGNAAASNAATAYAPQTPDQFGLERQQSQVLVKAVDARIVGQFDGWEPNQRFTLDNGQVWQVSDDSRGAGYKTNPKVRITRGTFGTFFMEIEGVNAAPRVKRLR